MQTGTNQPINDILLLFFQKRSVIPRLFNQVQELFEIVEMMATCYLLKTVMIFCCIYRCNSKQENSLASTKAYRSGDVILGALIPLHFRSESGGCGELYPFGFQLVEAMILTVERINRDNKLLPDIILGYDIRDYCSDPGLAMKHAYSLLQTASVQAIFGPAHSGDAVLVASLLQVLGVPGISSTATSDELSGPLYHSYFRTVSPDTQQAKAMADVIEHFNWHYVAAVADDDSYGRNGIASLEKESFKRGTFCIAFSEYVKAHDNKKQIESIVNKIKSKRTVKVVILWNEAGVLELILNEAQEQNMVDKTWFFSDYIGASVIKTFERYRDIVVGSIGVTPSFYRDPYYESHLRHATPLSTSKSPNPWWNEVWESLFGCVSNTASYTPKRKQCASDLSLTEEMISSVLYSTYASYTTDAIMAVAHALDSMYRCIHSDYCPHVDRLSPKRVTPFLQRVNFQGLTGRVSFDQRGDPTEASYEVMNVQSPSENESLRITHVGSWMDGVLDINDSPVYWNYKNLQNGIPQSVCKSKCRPGMYQTNPVMCCWECVECSRGTFSRRHGSSNCTACPKYQRTNADRTGCEDLPLKNVVWGDAFSVICSLLATVGFALTVLSLGVFVKYRDTPLVKGSSYHMSIFLLILIASCFVLSIVYLVTPSDLICRLVECWRSVALTLCVSILLLKTVQLICAFELSSPALEKAFKKCLCSQKSQFIFVFLINTVELCLSIAWLWIDPPYLYLVVRKEENVFSVCRPSKTSIGKVLRSVVVGYLFLISFFCTYCAIRVRNLPENFNEAKYIGFSMYILLLSWFTYQPVQSTLENWYVVIISSATLLLSAYGLLGCMFGPKLYVILLHPEKNTKAKVKLSISNYSFRSSIALPAAKVPVTPVYPQHNT